MLHSVRGRLTFWYAAVLLIGMLSFAAWMWLAVRHHLADTIDDRIMQRVHGLTYTIEEESNESFNALREELREFGESSREGDLIAARGRGSRELMRPRKLSENLLWGVPEGHMVDVFDHGTRYRVLHSRLTTKGEQYEIAVATSAADEDDFLAQFRLLLAWAAPVVSVIAAAGGYWISRRALAPVDELTSAARKIGLENLGERLDVRKTGDELERLGNTWNEMLGRLEDAVGRIRQFTADASHELRTPIAVIRTTAEIALRRERDPAEYRKALESVHGEAEWMSQLAEDLLLLARSDAGTLTLRTERVEVDELASRVAQETAALAEARRIAFQTEFHAEGRTLSGDGRALHRLLAILLDNAVQHTPPEGTVGIETTSWDGGVTVAVRNSGEGIRSEDLPHIFERFYRGEHIYRGDPARNGQNGAGLGLAIARSIATAHGAEIAVETAPGKGAVFSVRFLG